MPEEALLRKLKTLIAFRVLFVTALLGSFFVFQISYNVIPYQSMVPYLIVCLYGLSILYSLLLGKFNSTYLAYIQLIADVVCVTALIFITGGIESWFSSMVLPILVLSAAIVLNKRAGYVIATFSCIFYGTLLDLQYYGILAIPYDPMITEKDFLYRVFSNILALYFTAYLTGYLTAGLEKKDIDLRDLTLFNKEVIEHTPSGLFTTDMRGTVLLFNRAAEGITGIRRETATGMNIARIFPFMGRVGETAHREEALELGGKRVLGISVSKMKDAAGNETGFIGVFEDLTEVRKLADEVKLKENWAAVGELSANIAHEIRNPLASLKSAVELLREGGLDEAKKERLMSIALSETDRLNAIIADFLDYARPGVLMSQETDLHAVLDETLELIKGSSDNIIIRKNYKGLLPLTADPQRLKQVFINLGVNAMEAMPDGGELSIGTSAGGGGLVTVSFRDSGKGIKEADMERIFYPFFTTKERGTGLGLSIAYRIVNDHGGRITIKSGPGGGSEFRVLLPVGRPPGRADGPVG